MIWLSKKSLECKRHFEIVNVLKKSISATKITKHILSLDVSLTIRELLVLASVIKKQPTKAISEDKAVQLRINFVDIDNPVHIKNS